MEDENRTRPQLIRELASLRQRLAELEANTVQHRQTEAALARSEEFNRRLIEALPIGLLYLDGDGVVVYENQTMGQIMGVSAGIESPIIGQRISDLPSVREAGVLPLIRRSLDGETISGRIIEYQSLVGRQVTLELSLAPVAGSHGNWEGVIVIARDISGLMQAENALQQHTARLAALREVGLEVAAQLDLDQVLHSIVSRAAALLGETRGGLFLYQPEQDVLAWAIAVSERGLPVGAHLRRGEGLSGKIWETGQPLIVDNYQTWEGKAAILAAHASGGVVGVPIYWTDEFLGVIVVEGEKPGCFTDDDAELLSLFATQTAIAIKNARLHAEAQQRLAELTLLNRLIAASATGQSMQALLETACQELALAFDLPRAEAILLDTAKRRGVVAAAYLSGENQPPTLGETFDVPGNPLCQYLLEHRDLLVVDEAQIDPRLEPLRAKIRALGSATVLLVPLLVDGDLAGALELHAPASRAFSANEMALAQRVAEQVAGSLARARLEEERQQLEEQFHRAQKMEALGQMAGGIAHDFNNLLTVICTSAQLIEQKLHPSDPLAENIQWIREAGERATSLTQQLLSFSRREIVKSRILDLNQAVRDLRRMLQRVVGETVIVELLLAEDLWPVKAAPTQLDQVLVNLTMNAKAAMPDGGTLSIETANVVLDAAYVASHLEARLGEHVMLSIRDTGIGMDKEVKAHLFEPFFTTKDRGQGTGLGLPTVYGIVRQNQGHIQVESEVDEGSTFRIYLPRAQENRLTLTPALSPETQPAGGEETLLLVEDEPGVRNLAIHVLKAYNYQVLSARDGAEALQVAAQHDGPIDLLITDVIMPHMNGHDLADRLQAQRPKLRVLYMSGYADDVLAGQGLLAAEIAIVPKPFTASGLAHQVRARLDE